MRAPWVTFSNAFHSQPNSFERPPYLNGLNGVLRARGLVPACISEQGREGVLIHAHRKNEKPVQPLHAVKVRDVDIERMLETENKKTAPFAEGSFVEVSL